ncbi:ATP-binding protein [Glycomyces buryatensis]|uniref:ATP-binding protein n=1 Tax=Glycomyces buryatensis TaxID=2570927 RepID=A0A4S8QD34_9ACTN|nr:ATP-binding protein [Glycomyces buryatensis]THV42278.1 ATP-binding protein [Glycomyces buryatensis]
MEPHRPYIDRIIDPILLELFATLPALMLTGPRATGKTTTAARLAESVLRFDKREQAAVFEADPDAALASFPEPILIDEWQLVPNVLGAVKRAVDADHRPGRFILTGSSRDQLDSQMWPGTGRIVQKSMTGLTRREIEGDPTRVPFIDRVAAEGHKAVAPSPTDLGLADYLDLALSGGFPEPLSYPPGLARDDWFASYINQLVTRDAQGLDGHRDPVRLRRFFTVLALTSAGIVTDKTLYDKAEVNRATAVAYQQLLEALFILYRVPAWSTNRLKRLTKAPKRYLADPALLCSAAGLDRIGIMRDADLLGRVIDTFVTAQLRGEVAACRTRPEFFHLRQEDGAHEVDLVIELADQRVIAVEIKADSTPTRKAARHLIWMRDALGDQFAHGLLLHTGPMATQMDERITAAPISAIWR